MIVYCHFIAAKVIKSLGYCLHNYKNVEIQGKSHYDKRTKAQKILLKSCLCPYVLLSQYLDLMSYWRRRAIRSATPSVAFLGMTVTHEGTAAGLGSI